jgi:hypothetical protein
LKKRLRFALHAGLACGSEKRLLLGLLLGRRCLPVAARAGSALKNGFHGWEVLMFFEVTNLEEIT